MKDELFMQRAIELATLGSGQVAPNPMVGAVIVHEGRIIGEGYHQIFGGPHAEVNAINSVKNKALLTESTMYVTLEPCAHYGKTPPCCDLLIQHQFKRVVIGTKDPFAKVNGLGIEKMHGAGITIELGILEDDCLELNKRFFCFHQKKRPYIILKWAQTKDGYLDKPRKEHESGINWITQPETKSLVHKWRSEEQAILVGINTILNDNPSLTTREIKGKNPLRIVIDKSLQTPKTSAILDNSAPTLIYNQLKSELTGTVEYKKLDNLNLSEILKDLHTRNILSLIVEGGSKTLQSFISEHLWDEARVLIGIINFNEGLKAPELDLRPLKQFEFGQDQLLIYKNK